MKVLLGSDHAGVDLKKVIMEFLEKNGTEHGDVGVYEKVPVSYAEIAKKVCKGVSSGEYDRGILICGTGIGMSIAANKMEGIRCALCGDVYSARLTREHNDSNVLALGGRVLGSGLGLEIAKVWLETEFSGEERHVERIKEVMEMEKH